MVLEDKSYHDEFVEIKVDEIETRITTVEEANLMLANLLEVSNTLIDFVNCNTFEESKNKQIMTKNEIKKDLYRNKPDAILRQESGGYLYYTALLSDGSIVEFSVPKKESDGFSDLMEAQLLIRWLKEK